MVNFLYKMCIFYILGHKNWLNQSFLLKTGWLFLVSQVWTYISYEVVKPLILIRMVDFILKICIFYILSHKNWRNQPFLQKKVADFFGFASLDRFIVWNRQTTHSNQNGRLSIQNFNILHFGSQELAKSAIFAKKSGWVFGFASLDIIIVWSR